MKVQELVISTPSRLHFGLFSVGGETQRRFGGLGMMVDGPRTTIRFRSAESFRVTGPGAELCKDILERCVSALSIETGKTLELKTVQDIPLHIAVEEIPPRHAGFGSGTQFALATAVGAFQMLGNVVPSAEELATLLGRGKRSAVGTHGFFRGGLIVERGKSNSEKLAPLDLRCEFPADWPVVTVVAKDVESYAGSTEIAAFEALPPSGESNRNFMMSLVRDRIVPAIHNSDYETFGESLFEFGRNSGLMFAKAQGGPFNGPVVTELVEEIRKFGIRAVGQSSWGPCVFAITPDKVAAHSLTLFLKKKFGERVNLQVGFGDNNGAVIRTSGIESVSDQSVKANANTRG